MRKTERNTDCEVGKSSRKRLIRKNTNEDKNRRGDKVRGK